MMKKNIKFLSLTSKFNNLSTFNFTYNNLGSDINMKSTFISIC